MNKLSSTLNDAKVGCIMNDVYMNHLMYADDLVLIAPSVRALQLLLIPHLGHGNHVSGHRCRTSAKRD